MKVTHLTLLTLFILLSIGFTEQTLAANDLIVDIGEDVNIDHESWSSDSQDFVAIDQSSDVETIDASASSWWQYNLQMQTLKSDSRWPLQPVLTEREQNLFQPEGFIYASPNGRFIFYSKRSTDNNYHLALADRQQLREVITPIQDGPLGAPSPFVPVIWSENSLLLGFGDQFSPITPDFRVFALSLKVTDTDFNVDMKWFGDITIDGQEWFTIFDQMYDVSFDGKAILLSANNIDGGDGLIIWTPDNLDTNKVINKIEPRDFDAIAFAPNSIDRLLLVTGQGSLQSYNIATKQLITLRKIYLTGDNAFGVWFSPNGKWLANYFDYGKFRFIDTQALLPQATPSTNSK